MFGLSSSGKKASLFWLERRLESFHLRSRRLFRLGAGRQHGQDLLEFMILTPILFLFIFGVADLARVFHAMIVVGNAAREGSRYGIIYGLTLDLNCKSPPCEYLIFEDTNPANGVVDIIDITRAEALKLGVDLSTAGITVSCLPGASTNQQCRASGVTSGLSQNNHDQMVVSVNYPFTFLTGILFPNSTWNIIRTTNTRVP